MRPSAGVAQDRQDREARVAADLALRHLQAGGGAVRQGVRIGCAPLLRCLRGPAGPGSRYGGLTARSLSQALQDGPPIRNVGGGCSHTVHLLAEAVWRIAERTLRFECVPARPGSALQAFAGITLAREALVYGLSVGPKEGRVSTLDRMLAPRRVCSYEGCGEKR